MAEGAVDSGVGQASDGSRSQAGAAAGSDGDVATGDAALRGSRGEPDAVAFDNSR